MTDEEMEKAMEKAMEICKDKEIPCDDCPLVECGDCGEISRQYFYDRLKQLQSENAALRGRLGKFDDLHIHMGEKVYIIADDNEIIERFICGVHILSTEIIFVTTTQKNYKPCNKKGIAAHIAHAFENSFGLIPLRDFGERAFIHRESALARLAELKGEK